MILPPTAFMESAGFTMNNAGTWERTDVVPGTQAAVSVRVHPVFGDMSCVIVPPGSSTIQRRLVSEYVKELKALCRRLGFTVKPC